MALPEPAPGRSALGALITIALIAGGIAAAFAYTAGWFSPQRLTPEKLVSALAPPGGAALGHRRNHTKGICFTGTFEANGEGSALSAAPMLMQGEYPAIGRFNLASANLGVQDATVRVRGMGLQIAAHDGQLWRMALIDAPYFPVSTPGDFYALQIASGSKDPAAMPQFIAAHPGFAAFAAWAQSAPWTGSYAQQRYNSLDSFVFANASGMRSIVRWSLLPAAAPVAVTPAELAQRGADFLEQEISERIKAGPLQWALVVSVAQAADPTADPSKAWPEDRRAVTVGTLRVRAIEPERDGACRDINYDPTVLPAGMATSDDPFPAARSAAYRRSYDLRAAEEKYYPHAGAERAQ
jgi:catalase